MTSSCLNAAVLCAGLLSFGCEKSDTTAGTDPVDGDGPYQIGGTFGSTANSLQFLSDDGAACVPITPVSKSVAAEAPEIKGGSICFSKQAERIIE